MEVEFYDPEVSFLDPLTALTGVQSYKANIDLLAGRNPLGAWLFKDAGIALHGVKDTGPNSVRTRWTLQLTMHALPWHPTAYFTGVSDYTLSEGSGVIVAQRDYWDSLNLEAGSYAARSKVEGLRDFAAQLSPSNPERFTGLAVAPSTGQVVAEAVYKGLQTASKDLARRASAAVRAAETSKSEEEAKGGDPDFAGLANAFAQAFLSPTESGGDREDSNKEEKAPALPFLPRLPYVLLRRGKGYDVRRYPSSVTAANVVATSSSSCGCLGAEEVARLETAASTYLSGAGNLESATVVPFSPTVLTATTATTTTAAESTENRLSVPLSVGSDTSSPPAASGGEAGRGAKEVTVQLGLLSCGNTAAANGHSAVDCGWVVAVKRIPPKPKKAEEAKGERGEEESSLLRPRLSFDSGFMAARKSLLEAVRADGMEPAEEEGEGGQDGKKTLVRLRRASYLPLAVPEPALRVDEERDQENSLPADEVWVPLARHDWL